MVAGSILENVGLNAAEKHTYPCAIELISKGLVDLSSLVTHRFPPDQAVEAFHGAAWIHSGGAHHTSFSYSANAEHLQDFAEVAGVEFLLINENTRLSEFKKELRWNDLYYHLANGL